MPYEFKHTKTDSFDDYLRRHLEWGHATFGSPADGRGPLGPLNHIEKEIVEIKEDPTDLKEWIDLIILGIDGFLRAGGKLTMLLPMLFQKQATNALRNWPDWRGMDPTKAIEHVRTPEELAAKATAKADEPAADASAPDIYAKTAEALYTPHGRTKDRKKGGSPKDSRMKGGHADDR